MSGTSLKLLLDTNILVDEYIPTRPHAQATRKMLALAVRHGHVLMYPARAIADVFFQIGQYYKLQVREERGKLSESDARAIQEIAWSCIDNLCELCTAVGLDESDVWLARKYRSLNRDLEDNLVLAAAERANVDYLVTGDVNLQRKATVAALSPEDMLALLEARAGQAG